MADLAVGVIGAGGRMGMTVVQEVFETEGCTLVAAAESAGHPAMGRDAGEVAGLGALGVSIAGDAAAVFARADVVIEFALPEATTRHVAIAGETGTAHVIGTTGFDTDQEAVIQIAGKTAPVVVAPNMSLAVTILFALTKQVAGLLDERFDIEIVEMHHKHKVDAPSGTALGLGRAAAAGRGVDLDAVAQMARQGHTGARRQGDIGFAVLRGGDVVGDHSVVFAIEGERLELTHKASSRRIFSRGAVHAALWTPGKPPGVYSMADVLGL